MTSRKRKKNSKPESVTQITNSIDLDYDKLALAIVDAHKKIEAEKIKTIEIENEEWRREIGLRDFQGRPFRQIWNTFACLLRLIFLKRKDAKTSHTTYGLIQITTELIFSAIKWLLYVLSIVLYSFAVYSAIKDEWLSFGITLTIGVLIFIFGRLFRIAAFEIEIIKNRDELLTISSAVTSIIAMIIAVVALIMQIVAG